jgi:hypothetical protein
MNDTMARLDRLASSGVLRHSNEDKTRRRFDRVIVTDVPCPSMNVLQ